MRVVASGVYVTHYVQVLIKDLIVYELLYLYSVSDEVLITHFESGNKQYLNYLSLTSS